MIYKAKERAQMWADWLIMSTGAKHVVKRVRGGFEIHRVSLDAKQLVG